MSNLSVKKALTNNIGLKLLSLLFAFIVWLVVVNIDDPVISTSYSGVTVEVANGDSLTEKGKIYEILDNTNIIDVTITGKRSIVENIAKDNIRAVADIQDLSLMDTVEIKVFTNKNNDQLDSIKSSTPALQLNIEDLVEIHLPITVVVNGEPAEGYVKGDVATNQNTIRVSGPKSIIETINKAEAEVNISGRTSDITTSCDIKLYNKENEDVESEYISTNIKSVNLSATIYPVKAVEILYSYKGEVAEGYMVSGELESDRSAVYLAGRQSALDSISYIEIPDTVIDITDSEKSYEATIDLKKYIPDNVRFAEDDYDGKVKVRVPIEKTVERDFEVPISGIVLVNVPADYKAEILLENAEVAQTDGMETASENEANDKDVTMTIATNGILKEYDSFSDSDIRGYVDVKSYMDEVGVKNLNSGIYKIPITFNMPERIVIDGKYYADVKIELKANDNDINN